MAASRKLQAEIDRCSKKVSEGVEKFQDTWTKVHNATNTNLKEKYEDDLKKEIKKLQRLRDQIKTWIASAEIKDKSVLTELRKLIEVQMERFKVVERETKTKAYSKEGLTSANKVDPVEQERAEISQWLNNCLDSLQIQMDQFEADIEAVATTKKKKNRNENYTIAEKIAVYQNHLETHRVHVKKIETLLRMVTNDTVDIDQIKDIKDDVEYYIENCQEDNFTENEMVYDDIDGLEEMLLDLSNEKEEFAAKLEEPEKTVEEPKFAVKIEELEKTVEEASELCNVNCFTSTNVCKSKRTIAQEAELQKVADQARSLKGKVYGLKETSPRTSRRNLSELPINYPSLLPSLQSISQEATDRAGLSTYSDTLLRLMSQNEPPISTSVVTPQLQNSSSSSVQASFESNPSISQPVSTAVVTQQLENLSSSSVQASFGSNPSSKQPIGTSVVTQKSENSSSSSVQASFGSNPSVSQATSTSVVTQELKNSSSSSVQASFDSNPSISQTSLFQAPTTSSQVGEEDWKARLKAMVKRKTEAHIPPLLGVAPLGQVPLSKETQSQYSMLEAAFTHMPHPSDSEKLRPYLPRNPCATPVYYPQLPPANSDSLEFYQRLSTECLFFIFYYMEGTKAQYLAAKALKKHSWRFHTKYMMWFQRYEEPKVINDDFEQGAYIYFDFEKWGQRKKEGFTFEYRFLEDKQLI